MQVAAADLGIPLSNVYIAETATDKVPNSSPTAASASSDMYGSATADACAQLNARLKPYREKRPDSSFTELVNAAYLDRVDLSAHGFYATPDITGKLLTAQLALRMMSRQDGHVQDKFVFCFWAVKRWT